MPSTARRFSFTQAQMQMWQTQNLKNPPKRNYSHFPSLHRRDFAQTERSVAVITQGFKNVHTTTRLELRTRNHTGVRSSAFLRDVFDSWWVKNNNNNNLKYEVLHALNHSIPCYVAGLNTLLEALLHRKSVSDSLAKETAGKGISGISENVQMLACALLLSFATLNL